MITLYEFALSGNCHKIGRLLSLLGLEYLCRHARHVGGITTVTFDERDSSFLAQPEE